MNIGIGIVGLGWISEKVHLPFFSNNDDVNFIGVFDIDSDRAKMIKDKFKVDKIFNTYESLINSSKIDVVIIATPNHLHFNQVKEAIMMDKFVFCEKPLCITVEEVEGLKKLGGKLKNLFPLLPSRYTQEIQKTKEIVGGIGEIYKVKSSWNRGNGIPNSPWFTNKNRSGGGVLMDLGPHILDVVFYLLDFPTVLSQVSFLSSNFINQHEKIANWHGGNQTEHTTINHQGIEDNAQLFLKTEQMSINIDLSWAGIQKFDETKFEIHGTKGVIKIDMLFGFSQNRKINESTITYLKDNKEDEVIKFKNNNPIDYYYFMLSENLNKVKNKQFNLNYVFNSLKTMDIIHKAYKNNDIGEV